MAKTIIVDQADSIALLPVRYTSDVQVSRIFLPVFIDVEDMVSKRRVILIINIHLSY